MRALVLVFILIVAGIIAGVMTGYLNITHLRGPPPELAASRNSVSIKGGQAPAFDVEAGSVKVGTKPTTVNLPTLRIEKAPGQKHQDPATNNMM